MSEAAAEAPGADLRILVKGTSESATVTDKKGVEHQLCPLDLSDLIEYEDKMQRGLLSANLADTKLKDICYLLYLSIRKEGLSEDDIANRRFKQTERQIYMLFDLACFSRTAELFADLLRISGLDVRPQKASQ